MSTSRRVLHDHFLLTAVEREAIEAFLKVGFIRGSYSSLDGPKREVGVPQGTSISLFLANIAAWELDRALEGEGVRFVRYADDTLIWSTDYARLCSAVEILHSHAAAIGASVNAAKSPGIHLLLPPGVEGEIETVHHVDYLGHRMGIDCTQIKPAGEQRVMAHVDQLLFNTLLREPLRGNQNLARFSHGVDRDYVTMISRLRRYLYDLSEKALRRYQTRGAPLRRFKGLMSPTRSSMTSLRSRTLTSGFSRGFGSRPASAAGCCAKPALPSCRFRTASAPRSCAP